MKQELNEISINGVSYVRADSLERQPTLDPANACIVRCKSAGCFFGYPSIQNLSKGVITLRQARRLWYWDGAASLSELAVSGTSKPQNCKFPIAVPEINLTEVIEVIPCTLVAVQSLNSVSIWKA